MKTVDEILNSKGKIVFTISPEATVYEALKLMAEKDIGALVVVDSENVVGILSERDYARKVMLSGKSSSEVKVEDIMSPKVMYVSKNQDVEDCMALMTNKRIRHLPVLENEKLVGIISIGDIVKAVIEEKEFLIEHLAHYIKGTPSIKSE
jgi:CBS domain-containing protein